MERKGRPKKAKKQEKNLGFFVTRAQFLVIQGKVDKAGVTMSDYLRQVAVYSEVRPRWTVEERECFRQLIALCNDIHQLVGIARQEGAAYAVLHFEKYRDMMDGIIKKCCHDQ